MRATLNIIFFLILLIATLIIAETYGYIFSTVEVRESLQRLTDKGKRVIIDVQASAFE